MTGTRIAIAFSLGAGIAGAAQAVDLRSARPQGGHDRLGRVRRRAGGDPRRSRSRWRSVAVARSSPRSTSRAWLWLGGLFGAVIVLAIAYAPPRIGTFATVALLIAGQLAAGALIDAFGWFGSPRIPVTATRAAGLLLVAAGAALTLKR